MDSHEDKWICKNTYCIHNGKYGLKGCCLAYKDRVIKPINGHGMMECESFKRRKNV
jgi:hypothetical protein